MTITLTFTNRFVLVSARILSYLSSVICVFLFVLTCSNLLNAQGPLGPKFISPLEGDLRLSGNFGELRSSHFHAGLDIKTNLTIGKPVYAAADGYVSRLKVAHFGYGKALYLTHQDGFSSVYAHLDRFSPSIQDYIKQTQYKKEQFQVELFPSKDQFIVKQGDLIGYTGNTGSSGGPHLHFEIRDPQSRPLNPLIYGIQIEDSKRPLPTSLRWYPRSESDLNIEAQAQNLSLTKVNDSEFIAETLETSGWIGFGLGVYDQQDGSLNKNGVYQIRCALNGSLVQEVLFDRISFDETKYMNRYMDYRYYQERKQRVQKLFRPSNNPLGILKNLESDGFVEIIPGSSYTFTIELFDFNQNRTLITVPILGGENTLSYNSAKTNEAVGSKQSKSIENSIDDWSNLVEIPHTSATSWSEGNFSIFFPKECFYESTALNLSVSGEQLYMDKDQYPLYKPVKITYRGDHLSTEDLAHAYIARLDDYGKPIHQNTSREGTQLDANVSTLGQYGVFFDYTPPIITMKTPAEGQWFSTAKKLKVIIKDSESGIADYRATINDRFVLMEYDYKTNTLTYDFSDAVVDEAAHNLKVVVLDNAGNSATFERLFYRKAND
ncbi:MAG: M23 family metallopeptidase [Flavobacteriaceae bacterium]|nr:M23 family metallopeptidase [Flavobacteriaceae bacterium]